eukprot:403352377
MKRINALFAKYFSHYPYSMDQLAIQFEQKEKLSQLIKTETSIEQILKFLDEKQGFIIILMDVSKRQTYQNDQIVIDESIKLDIQRRLSQKNKEYLGHYLLLIGYDGESIIYLDPASTPDVKYITLPNFEICRKAQGTDQDTIFIHF